MAVNFIDLQSFILSRIDNGEVELFQWGTDEPTGETCKIVKVTPGIPRAVVYMADGNLFDITIRRRGS
jgi:hypothetical protein